MRRDSPHTVYVALNERFEIIYVGITGNGRSRLHNHAKDSLWWEDAREIRLIHVPDRDTALALEAWLIVHLDPLWNVADCFPPSLLHKGRATAIDLGLAIDFDAYPWRTRGGRVTVMSVEACDHPAV